MDEDFFIGTAESYISLWQSISGAFFAVFVMVSSISAVVGGIVIMNVMLVSVTERTKEIGIRRAVGATQNDILQQFLTESVMQCLIGGIVGILIGFALRGGAAEPDQLSGERADVGGGAGRGAELHYRALLRDLSRDAGGEAGSGGGFEDGVMTRGELYENLRVALDTLRSRKVRSALTILGIVIGVTSVITVASIIEGLNGYIQRRVQSIGSRSFFITRIPAGFGKARLPEKIRLRKYIEFGDAQYLKEAVPAVEYTTSFSNRINFGEQVDSMRYGNEHVERLFVRGVEPEYAHAFPLFAIAEGRFISQYDLEHSRNVVVHRRRPSPIRCSRISIRWGRPFG